MSDSSRDDQSTKPESDKKQPETVQLTAEELRAIAGGGTYQPPKPITPTPTPTGSSSVLKTS